MGSKYTIKKLKTTLLTLALTALVSAAGWVFNWFMALGNQASTQSQNSTDNNMNDIENIILEELREVKITY